jgi:cob(I)alamin adenosyltransferase
MSASRNHAGDDGTTGLLGQGRLPKYAPRLEALGALDEASAALGLARAFSQDARTGPILAEVQRDLYALMAEVAAAPENADAFRTLAPARLEWLESQTETLAALAPMPEGFILPGDSPAGATLDLARTVVRRAERRVAELLDRGEIANRLLQQYLNRLSSLCFALELLENRQAGKSTSLAKK